MENLFQIVQILVGEGKVASLEATENEKINIIDKPGVQWRQPISPFTLLCSP